MTWEIFLGIAAIVSFITAIVVPMLKLNTSITKLTSSVGVLQASIDRLETDNKEGHARLWKHNDEQDKVIAEHSKAITNFKHIVYMAEQMSPNVKGLHNQLDLNDFTD